MSDRWPALMTRETAAEYCDMSPLQFDRQCPVAPVDQGWRGLRWKRAKLDAWIENLPTKTRERPQNDAGGVDVDPPTAPDREAATPEARKQAALSRL